MSFSGTKIRYRGIDKDSTIVWKPKHYDVDRFDFDKVKARIEKCKEEGDKKALEVITSKGYVKITQMFSMTSCHWLNKGELCQ